MIMRKEYDFSNAKPSPYAAKLKRQITIRLDEMVVEYFKKLADEFDIPYQNLINSYLRECTAEAKRPRLKWAGSVEQIAGFDSASRRKSA